MRPCRPPLAAAALAVFVLAAPAPAADLKIGATAPEFNLPAASDGTPVALKELLSKNKGVAILFIATKCPVSNAYNERMAALAKEYVAQGIAFVGINSNKSEPAAETAEHAKKHGFGFFVVKDPGNKVADAYGAQKTPEVFLLNGAGKLIYHGRIDENQDDAGAAKSPDFKNALDAFLAGKPVPVAETKAFGCTIKRV